MHTESRLGIQTSCLPILLLLGAIFLFYPASTHARTFVADPGIPDTLRIDSIVVPVAAGTAQIPVRFVNDEELGAIEVTLHATSPTMTVDSFSFVGGRVASIPNKGVLKSDDTLRIYCVPLIGTIPIGSGLLGTIFVTFPTNSEAEVVKVDSTTIRINDVQYSTTFSTSDAQFFKPMFKAGYLNIQNFCCIGLRGNIDNDPAQNLNILDVLCLVYYLFADGDEPYCKAEADVNGSHGETPDTMDLVFLINYMFLNGPAPSPCPPTTK